MYLDEMPGHCTALNAALRDGDAAALSRTAHALKSASFNVGARGLAEQCMKLERQGRAGELAGAAELVAEIERLLRLIEPALLSEVGVPA